MLTQDIQCPIAISVDHPPLSGAVQPTFDALATEFILSGIVSIPNGKGVAIQRTRLTGVRLFLLDLFLWLRYRTL